MNTNHQRRTQAETYRRVPKINPNGIGVLLPGLWTARVIAGLSQMDLAKKAEIGPSTVQEVERIRRGAYPKTVRKLSQALGVRPLDLMTDPVTQLIGDDNHV